MWPGASSKQVPWTHRSSLCQKSVGSASPCGLGALSLLPPLASSASHTTQPYLSAAVRAHFPHTPPSVLGPGFYISLGCPHGLDIFAILQAVSSRAEPTSAVTSPRRPLPYVVGAHNLFLHIGTLITPVLPVRGAELGHLRAATEPTSFQDIAAFPETTSRQEFLTGVKSNVRWPSPCTSMQLESEGGI